MYIKAHMLYQHSKITHSATDNLNMQGIYCMQCCILNGRQENSRSSYRCHIRHTVLL